MGAGENKEIVRTMFAELSKGNAEAFLSAMADDVRFTLIGTTAFSGVFNGKAELIEKVLAPLGAQLEGGLAMHVDSLIAEGDHVVMQGRGESTTKSGKAYNNTYTRSSQHISEWGVP